MKRSWGIGAVLGTVIVMVIGLVVVTPAHAGTLTAGQKKAQATAHYWLDQGGLNLVLAQPVRQGVDLGLPDDDLRVNRNSALTAPKLPAGVGRVFFVDDQGKRRWCSGVALQSRYGNVVATAGQCADQALDRWIFVPGAGSALGQAPLGAFVGQQSFTHYDFTVYDDYDRNYAFVVVHDGVALKRGKLSAVGKLADVVPAQGFAWNHSNGARVVMGYPAGLPVDFWFRSPDDPVDQTFPMVVASLKGEELVGIRPSNPFVNSLGSAWLLQYNASTKLGYLNGITIANSSGLGDGAISISATFDTEAADVYRSADLDTGAVV